jgi:hypothetical protein
MVTLNKKQSNKFIKKMIKKETSPISKKDKKLARDVKKTMEQLEIERKYNPTIKKIDNGLCARCHKNKATITYAESVLNWSHGYSELICQECYDKIKYDNTWYKEGRKDAIKEEVKFLKTLLQTKELSRARARDTGRNTIPDMYDFLINERLDELASMEKL